MKVGETVRLKAWKWKVGEKEKKGRFFFVFWSSTFKWFRKTAEKDRQKDGSGVELMASGAVYSEKED